MASLNPTVERMHWGDTDARIPYRTRLVRGRDKAALAFHILTFPLR